MKIEHIRKTNGINYFNVTIDDQTVEIHVDKKDFFNHEFTINLDKEVEVINREDYPDLIFDWLREHEYFNVTKECDRADFVGDVMTANISRRERRRRIREYEKKNGGKFLDIRTLNT